MSGYKSGLSYEALKKAADANALDTLSRGGFRKNGSRLQAVLTYRDTDGKRKYLARNLSETKASGRGRTLKGDRDAMLADWREQVVADIKEASRVLDDPTKLTRDAVAAFIKSKDVRDKDGNAIGARASTLTFYRSCAKRIERYPRVADKPLLSLTEADVQAWVNSMAGGDGATRPLSKKSISDALNLLSQVCRKFKLAVNPCDGVSVPKNARAGKNADSADQGPNHLSRGGIARLNRLLDEREAKSDGIDNVVLGARIALHTGMRCEEISGLCWRDVDLLNKKIFVRNVIQRASELYVDEDGTERTRYYEADAEPKTKGSKRTIPINATLAAILTEHRGRVAAMVAKEHPRAKSVDKYLKDMYVLTKSERGSDGKLVFTHVSPHRLGVNLRKWARKNGVLGSNGSTIGMHDLRHSWATAAIQAGMPISEVSKLLGHSKITTTLNIYVGTDEEEQRKVVDAMADIFSARTPDDVVILPTGTEGR